MFVVTAYALPLIPCCTITLLSGHFLPLVEGLCDAAQTLLHVGDMLEDQKNPVEMEARLVQQYNMLVRDLASVLPLLLSFIDHHKGQLQGDEKSVAMELFSRVGAIFHCWFKSPHFRREYQTFLVTSHALDTDNVASRATGTSHLGASAAIASLIPGFRSKSCIPNEPAAAATKAPEINPLAQCLKALLPICMDSLTNSEQSLVHEGQGLMLQNSTEEDMIAYIEIKVHGAKVLSTKVLVEQSHMTVR